MAWVYEFLGGCLCNRCGTSLASFAKHIDKDWKRTGYQNRNIGERIVLAWMCRMLDHHARHQRKWGAPRLSRPALHKTEEHKLRLSISVRAAKNG